FASSSSVCVRRGPHLSLSPFMYLAHLTVAYARVLAGQDALPRVPPPGLPAGAGQGARPLRAAAHAVAHRRLRGRPGHGALRARRPPARPGVAHRAAVQLLRRHALHHAHFPPGAVPPRARRARPLGPAPGRQAAPPRGAAGAQPQRQLPLRRRARAGGAHVLAAEPRAVRELAQRHRAVPLRAHLPPRGRPGPEQARRRVPGGGEGGGEARPRRQQLHNKLSGQLPPSTACADTLEFVDVSANLLIGACPACMRSNSSARTVLEAGAGAASCQTDAAGRGRARSDTADAARRARGRGRSEGTSTARRRARRRVCGRDRSECVHEQERPRRRQVRYACYVFEELMRTDS
uniref:Uncharacterized protein n=2 Tax=Aegilops tauschii subsp. strangulata TaxID=200361 RepID=A0A453RDP1_AEGTS